MNYKNVRQVLEVMDNDEQTALINHEDKALSYKDLYRLSINLANKLNNSSERVVMLLPNDFSFAISLFAIWFAGKTAVPLGVGLKDNEICSIANYCGADTIIVEAEDVNREFEGLKKIVLTEQFFKQKNIINDYSCFDAKPSSIALILPTTGTSSKPKYVELTHANILSSLEGISKSFQLVEGCCELIIGPLSYVTSLIAQLLAVLYSKGNVVIYRGQINPLKIARLINQYKVIYSGATTSLAKLIFNNASPEDLASLKGLVTGGEPVTKSFIEMLSSTLPHCRIIQSYGMTETCSMITGDVSDSTVPIGSAGKPMHHVKIRIARENGEECPVGMRGEILVQGDCVTKGYYKNETLNAATFIDDWFKTGDIGMLDEQGNLFVLGRIKNMLIVGGQNVYPEEVEECLLSHPLVQNAFVYGEKHEVLGEVPIAKIVLKPGAAITENALYNYCKEHLSNFKIPKQILFEESVHLNAVGKQIRIKKST